MKGSRVNKKHIYLLLLAFSYKTCSSSNIRKRTLEKYIKNTLEN